MKMPVSRSLPVTAIARVLLVRAAVGSVLVGLPYALRLLGPVEAEVTHWGWLSIGLGCLLLLLAWVARARAIRAAAAAFAAATAGAVALLQVLPALLWVLFHGQPITDGSPPGGFVGYWALSLPHVAVAALALAALYHLLRARPVTDGPDFAEVLGAHESGEPVD